MKEKFQNVITVIRIATPASKTLAITRVKWWLQVKVYRLCISLGEVLSKGYPKRNPKDLNKQQLEKLKEKLLVSLISSLFHK